MLSPANHVCAGILARRGRAGFFLFVFLAALVPLRAADIEAARKRFIGGAYDEVIATATAARREAPGDVEWPLLLGEALGRVGRYAEAADELRKACKDFPLELRL